MSERSGNSGQSDTAVSLDGLFRSNAAARPGAIALSDPANRASFTDGRPLRLTYSETDERIERLTRRLLSLGMPAGSVVAVQLPNVAESVISLLAILRAGMVAAPVPTLWRRSDLVAALAGVSPKAFISLSHLDGERPAETLCEAAGDLFELSFPCVFGEDVPDGVIALDGDEPPIDASVRPFEANNFSSVSLVTFDADADGFFAVGRNDAQWLAAGLAAFLEAGIKPDDTIITCLPLNSLAGIGAAFVPWLLSGGSLELIHGHAPDAVRSAAVNGRAHLLGPAAALGELAGQSRASFAACLAVHRGGRQFTCDLSGVRCERIVDFHCFGETAAIALARETPASMKAIPLGGVASQTRVAAAPVTLESRIAEGRVWLRGPMIPREAFPAGTKSLPLKLDSEGFVCTGFYGRSDGIGGIVVEAGPEHVIAVGGLRFGLNDLRARFSKCCEDIKVRAVDDPILGQRLQIETAKPEAAIAAMRAAGHSRLVIDATVGTVRGGSTG